MASSVCQRMATEAPAFPHLFSPLQLRQLHLPHRISFGAHTANMAEDGLPGRRHHDYYLERARGGAALIVTEPVPVHPTSILTRGNFRCDDDAIIAPFRRITDACHAEGTAMLQQLYHLGQHCDSANSWRPNWSPSGLPSYHDSHGSHAMTEAEIEEVLAGFTRAAGRAQAAGFDGVEIFAGYSCLVDQFWAPWSNRRDDRWGGSRANRMRFSNEIVERIRRSCGEDFVIGFALSFDPGAPILVPEEELFEILRVYDRSGDVDYVSCGTGSYYDTVPLIPSSFQPDRFGQPFAARARAELEHLRVQAESQLRTPHNAEALLAARAADLVSLVRAQIADPRLAAKAREGRADEIRPCIACNQLCRGRRNRDYWISCLVNPRVGRESDWPALPREPSTASAIVNRNTAMPADQEPSRSPGTAASRRAIIVGAGPAGLEAARVAALFGARVTLYEEADSIGGRYRLAGLQPSRERILEHLAWYERELTRLGVELRRGERARVDELAAGLEDGATAAPDRHLLIATGALPAGTGFQRSLPELDVLPGAEPGGPAAERVLTVDEVLSGSASPKGRIVLLDELGDWQGLGTALALQSAGADVTLVTAGAYAGAELSGSGADKPLRKAFARAGGRVLPFTLLRGWTPEGARAQNSLTEEQFLVPAEWLVLAAPALPNAALPLALSAAGISFDTAGDCVAGRSAAMAIYEGQLWARSKFA